MEQNVLLLHVSYEIFFSSQLCIIRKVLLKISPKNIHTCVQHSLLLIIFSLFFFWHTNMYRYTKNFLYNNKDLLPQCRDLEAKNFFRSNKHHFILYDFIFYMHILFCTIKPMFYFGQKFTCMVHIKILHRK